MYAASKTGSFDHENSESILKSLSTGLLRNPRLPFTRNDENRPRCSLPFSVADLRGSELNRIEENEECMGDKDSGSLGSAMVGASRGGGGYISAAAP